MIKPEEVRTTTGDEEGEFIRVIFSFTHHKLLLPSDGAGRDEIVVECADFAGKITHILVKAAAGNNYVVYPPRIEWVTYSGEIGDKIMRELVASGIKAPAPSAGESHKAATRTTPAGEE